MENTQNYYSELKACTATAVRGASCYSELQGCRKNWPFTRGESSKEPKPPSGGSCNGKGGEGSVTPPPPARDKVSGSAPPAQDRVHGSADRHQSDLVTAGLEADFAWGRRVNSPSPRRPRTKSQARPRWPQDEVPRHSGSPPG